MAPIYRCKVCEKNTLTKIYKLSDYDVYKCSKCGTGMVMPFPDEKILETFYKGFTHELRPEKIIEKVSIAQSFFQKIGISDFKGKLFLDLGGGNGLFSYAFEQLHGCSTYIDRDPKSCDFVREKLKISNVIQSDVNKITDFMEMKKYDVIYSRHLIEHLPDPFSLIKESLKFLKPGGTAIFQCPNGASLEYLAYNNSNLWDRFNNIVKATGCSKTWLFWHFISGDILHGIDPPRHLWAISKRGLYAWAERHGYNVHIFTAHLGDLAFSPGYFKRDGVWANIEDFIGQRLLAPIRGGTHLIAKFRQSQ